MGRYNNREERVAFYTALVIHTGSRCMICQRTDKLVIDHNHVSGELRGLLCHACNIGLGQFRDDPTLLTEAAKYLEERGHSNQMPPDLRQVVPLTHKEYIRQLLEDPTVESDSGRAKLVYERFGGSLSAIKMQISRLRKTLPVVAA